MIFSFFVFDYLSGKVNAFCKSCRSFRSYLKVKSYWCVTPLHKRRNRYTVSFNPLFLPQRYRLNTISPRITLTLIKERENVMYVFVSNFNFSFFFIFIYLSGFFLLFFCFFCLGWGFGPISLMLVSNAYCFYSG